MNFQTPVLIFEMPCWHSMSKQYQGFELRLAYKNAVKVFHRTRLAEAQNWRCCWCGCRMTEVQGRKHSATVEHVTPRSHGGVDDPDNYAVACNRCNNARGTLDVDEFLALRATHNYTDRSYRAEFLAYGIRGGFGRRPKLSKREDQLAAMKAARNSDANPFEPGTRTHKLFERYRNSAVFDKAA